MSTVSVPLDVAQKDFDIATESLDFGSGFLVDDEVEALRAFAVEIGADVWKATPDNFLDKYHPVHEWGDAAERYGAMFYKCVVCGKGKVEHP